VLSRYIAGVKATDVAWSTYEVKPNLAHMTSLKQIVPSVKGGITIEVNKTENRFNLNLISPEKTTATIFLPKGGKKIVKILINNKEVWKKGKLKNKMKKVELLNEDSEYVSFKAKEGNWKFKAIYK
jgi:hypothetical protein